MKALLQGPARFNSKAIQVCPYCTELVAYHIRLDLSSYDNFIRTKNVLIVEDQFSIKKEHCSFAMRL